ncbi:hypothetical protein [Halomonas cerina]|nr:hypothetical protein [Halomonas cerina]
MPMPIVYIDTSTIREGKHETLKAAVNYLSLKGEACNASQVDQGKQ